MSRATILLAALAALCITSSASVVSKRQVLAASWPYGAAGAYGWPTAASATAWPSAYGAWPYAAWPVPATASIPAAVNGKPVLNYMSASSLQLAEAIAASHPNKDTKITVINRA